VVGSEASLHAWTVDGTGTINTSVILSEREIEQHKISEMNNITIPEEILQVHGYAPSKKADGTVRLIYENVNGFQNQLSENKKVNRAKEIHDELEVDIMACCEHKLNIKHKKNCNGSINYSKGGRPQCNRWWPTMSTKTSGGPNREEQAYFFSDT
jgi:hypothetical protein